VSAKKTSLLLILLVCAASAVQPVSPRRGGKGLAARSVPAESPPQERESLEEVEAALLRAAAPWRLKRAAASYEPKRGALSPRVQPPPPALCAEGGEHRRVAQLPRRVPPPDEAAA
jgi:hypothetical protein